MLVVTRKVGEKIIINNGDITIEIVRINGNQVRVGINADRDKYTINREEVQLDINTNGHREKDNE